MYVRVIPSSEVHKYKNVVYDRAGDADIKCSTTNGIAQMYIRKQNVFTDKKNYKYVKPEHLRLDLLRLCRQRAINKRFDHPWKDMDDMDLLRSAKLYSQDFATGEQGFNLAAVMLLGRDEVIGSILPAYKTDAILRVRNIDRYDDRLIVNTNLIESFDLLMGFAQKHLWDKFYLDEYQHNVSVRDKIAREMLANTLIHREYSSPYIAKFIIEKSKMYTENALGNADELGSGTRNLFKYTKIYSSTNPELFEDDIFKSVVPFDFDEEANDIIENEELLISNKDKYELKPIQNQIIDLIKHKPQISYLEIAETLNKSRSGIANHIQILQHLGILIREGSDKKGIWKIVSFGNNGTN